MSQETEEQSSQLVDIDPALTSIAAAVGPTTPRGRDDVNEDGLFVSSQATIPSTEGPPSPIDAASTSFKTELNDDRIASGSIIPSSLTPPPSSQLPATTAATRSLLPASHQMGYSASQRTGIFSPPATELRTARPDGIGILAADFIPPTPKQVLEAAPDELRSYLQACIAEHAKLKMEAAHHKLQYNLMSLQADEDAKRAAVEHEMTRREVDALRVAEDSRQARHELSAASESAHAKYLQLRVWYEHAVDEIDSLTKRLKLAKKVIQQKTDDISLLTDERDMLLNRIRENREHFHALCSPGGMFHAAAVPQPSRAPTRHQASTPKSAHREARGPEAFDVLLKAATQENNSAPSTPTTGYRPAPRLPTKHTRNVQSMSSLPTTPTSRPRGGADQSGLLPSADLVPHTEPGPRYGRFIPETPTSSTQRRKSRESTISVEDAEDVALATSRQHHNEELARQALNSFVSRSGGSASSRRGGAAEEEVYESQASQAASAMLRRDPRESFEVASTSFGSRDGTPGRGSQANLGGSGYVPAAAEKSAKLQAKLFAGLNKSGVAPGGEKRKFSGGQSGDDAARRESELLASPTKKLRMAGGLREPGRVGLGIRYSQDP
ncbi:hypothetical protein GE09DRAFT_728194 [Coniochaeta sp. 2T2.1]|nr:hypothetical protein GE09DRAFT_728194 [Coniochaeta sp. 2T2.1]